MAVEIVTGYTGKPHITSRHDAIINAATLGTGGKYVVNVGNQFGYELVSNTIIRINDGYAINQGRLMGMSNGDYEELEISAGISETKRSDLVVIHYEKDSSSGIETAELRVIEGIAGDDYADPEYLENDLLNGNYSEDDLVLYRVNINGLSIASIEPLFNTWYLDTGWREDQVTQNVANTDGPPGIVAPAVRVMGNTVYFRGYQYISLPSDGVNFTIPKELAPDKPINWILNRGESNGANDFLYFTIDTSGNITVKRSIVDSYPILIPLDKIWILN